MPLPYMGSKNKSCSKIVNVIEAYYPNNNKKVFELFCWWFAVWEEFLKKWYSVIANDKNKYVIALLKQVINKKLDEKKCLEWVSREKFNDILKNPNKYEDWYVWYVMNIRSFWNNQKWYLFWEENENKKHSLYELVVNKKSDEFVKQLMPQKYIDWICKQDTRNKRRMALKKVLWVLKTRIDMDNLQSFERLQQLERLNAIQSLESLERLERLERLENKVIFMSKSYDEVEVETDCIVYCDPLINELLLMLNDDLTMINFGNI